MKHTFLILLVIVIAAFVKNFDFKEGLDSAGAYINASIGKEVSEFKKNNN